MNANAPMLQPPDAPATLAIDTEDHLPRRRVQVLDTQMDYVDVGEGAPIVFLHGNPTSSYLWRNVIPHLAGLGRCLAPDLVGMGRSGPSPRGAYRFLDQARYLDAWFDAVGVSGNVVLVLHDWGSALGFHRAAHRPHEIAGIAHMEALVAPLTWEDFGGPRAALFQALRSGKGEALVLEENAFVEQVLPRGVVRPLRDQEMAAYRAPFPDAASRLPTLVWPRQLPVEGEPAEVVAVVERYGSWLAQTSCPKLLVLGEPGAVVTGRVRELVRRWPNQTEVTVRGRHFLQEDSPHEIGEAVAAFVRRVRG